MKKADKSKIPSNRERTPSWIKTKGKIAIPMVKRELPWMVRLGADIPALEIKAAKAITKERSMILAPTMSPKESSGTLFRAEIIPTNRFGIEVAKDRIKKATTNSFQPKNLAILLKAPTKKLVDQKSKAQEERKIKI